MVKKTISQFEDSDPSGGITSNVIVPKENDCDSGTSISNCDIVFLTI
jgi:hypothetical protein